MSSGSSPASDHTPGRTRLDDDPEHLAAARQAVTRWSDLDVHALVSARLGELPDGPVLDVGCGDGALHAALAPGTRRRWVGLDRSAPMVGVAPRPTVCADALALPVATGRVAAIAALSVLYHLPDPVAAVREAARVLRPGGLFLASTTRRDDAPELAAFFDNPTTTFDAEEAPDVVATVLEVVEVVAWDAPHVHLPDRDAVRSYLRGRGASPAGAAEAAAELPAPLSVTERGCLVIGRRP